MPIERSVAEAPRINAVEDLARAREALRAAYDLEPSEAAIRRTHDRYRPLERVIPPPDWARFAPYVLAIARMKKERDAIILAHNYMTPEIFHGVADVVGDSLQLAVAAQQARARVIVQCGVHFMAETAKILNPDKTVLIPDSRAGCSLAASICAADITALRARHPGAPVVSYVNTTAEVKAASDICCTSSNALRIVDGMEGDTVIMTPDGYLARNIAQMSRKKIVWWEGTCEVHARFSAGEIRAFRAEYPDISVLAHPECPPSVVDEADFAGSTAAMIAWVKRERPPRALMVTECSMSDNVAAELPEVDFIRPCNICPHMKRITLENILWSLHTMSEEVTVAPAIARDARRALTRMIAFSTSPAAQVPAAPPAVRVGT